MKKSLLL